MLTAFAAIGIGVGSLAAGRLSGDKVELGLAPIGAIGMGVFAIAARAVRPLVRARGDQSDLVGFFGGLFAVPLNALLQQRSGGQEKGRLMATNNFLNMVGDPARVGGALAAARRARTARPTASCSCSASSRSLSSVYVL